MADEGVRVWVLIIEASMGTYSVTSLSYSVDLKGSIGGTSRLDRRGLWID